MHEIIKATSTSISIEKLVGCIIIIVIITIIIIFKLRELLSCCVIPKYIFYNLSYLKTFFEMVYNYK